MKMDPDPLASAETITLMRAFRLAEIRIEFLNIYGIHRRPALCTIHRQDRCIYRSRWAAPSLRSRLIPFYCRLSGPWGVLPIGMRQLEGAADTLRECCLVQ